MEKYEINDIEICKKTVVEAPGMVEAMLEYLPWPTLQLTVDYRAAHGMAKVIDQTTDFMYEIQIL